METDDSEEGNIDCLKLGEVAAKAASEIAKLTSELESLATLSMTLMITMTKNWKQMNSW